MRLYQKHHPHLQPQKPVLYRIMEAWTGNEVTVSCEGGISVHFQQSFNEKLTFQQTKLQRPQRNTKNSNNVLNQILNQKRSRRNTYQAITNPNHIESAHIQQQDYVFRAQSPSPVSKKCKFSQMADEYSSSRLKSQASRSRKSSRKHSANNTNNKNSSNSRKKKYTFNFPSSIKPNNKLSNKQNNFQNFDPATKPCIKPTLFTNFNPQKKIPHSKFPNLNPQLDSIAQSIKQISLPQENFLKKNMHREYSHANTKFQRIKDQIIEEIKANTSKESEIQIELDEILGELKMAADNIIAQYHNTHSRNNNISNNHKKYNTEAVERVSKFDEEISEEPPKLKGIFSFSQNKNNEKFSVYQSHAKGQNYSISPEKPQKLLTEESIDPIKLPQFKDNNKSISSIMSDDPRNQNSLEPIGDMIEGNPANNAEPQNKQQKQVNKNKYIMIENDYHNQFPTNEKNKEQGESVTSIKMPIMKPIELDNSGVCNHADKNMNDSEMSLHSNKVGISLADIFSKIAVHDSVSSNKPSDFSNSLKNQQTYNIPSSFINPAPQVKIQSKIIKEQEKYSNYPFLYRQQQADNSNKSPKTDPISPPNNNPKSPSMQPINICEHGGMRFMRKQMVVKHLVDRKIIQKESNSIEYGNYPFV